MWKAAGVKTLRGHTAGVTNPSNLDLLVPRILNPESNADSISGFQQRRDQDLLGGKRQVFQILCHQKSTLRTSTLNPQNFNQMHQSVDRGRQ